MRIVGRSESPSFPPLETLLPMEKSWALEAEREEETLCLHAKNEHLHRGTESVKRIESSWVSCKRLNSGSKEASHRSCERESEHYSKRASRSFDSKPYNNDQHHDLSRRLEETPRACQFTPSSRCYPPSVHVRSSEIFASAEEGAPRLRTQRGLDDTRKFVRPDRSSNSFVCRQHFTRSDNDFSSERKGVKQSVNTLKGRQGRFACPDHRGEMTSVYEASGKHKGHGDDLSHSQGHQELDEGKHEFQPLFDKHSQYRCSQDPEKFSEHRSRYRRAKKMEHQGPSRGVTGWKSAKHLGGRSIESEMKQHNEAILAVQNFKYTPQNANGESVASEVVATTENALPEGISTIESSCMEESEVKSDDSIVVKKQYEMLACLLFDDLQDMDEDFDVACVGEGPGCEYSASIFDDELEVGMDTDVVKEDKEDMPGKLPAPYITNHPNCNSGKAPVAKSSASQLSTTSHDIHSSPGLKKSPPVLVDVTNKFEIHTSAGVKGEVQEDDAHRLSQRQRQIDFGKNTLGYEHYNELVPRIKRKAKDPQTPNPKQVCSKRSWDGQIRKWRRLLHVYDPPSEDGEEIAEDFSILKLQRSTCPDAKQDTSLALRFAEADERKGCIAVGDGKNVGDANLTIYDDWMES